MQTIKERAKAAVRAWEDAGHADATETLAAVELLREIANAPEAEPVLVVKVEPDYWHRGHYCEGSKPYINPRKVWKLPVGTKLYTAPPAPSVQDGLREAVSNLTTELEELIAETSGVYGLHLNGDVSPWEEILEGGRFERISSLHIVQNLLSAQQPEPPADLVREAELVKLLELAGYELNACQAAIQSRGGFDQAYVKDAQAVLKKIDAAIERRKLKGQS